ncbi:MAG TPA: MFS transporter [Acidimicrobiales bacterium]|nr:MFS transporter [Acidimicrobiales bacterium]
MPLSDASKIPSTRLSSSVLITVLVLTMALGAFPIVGTAVVATALANDLGMSLTMFGAGVSVNTIVGALCAPLSGRFSDRYGGKWSCVLVLLSSGIGLLIVAIATSVVGLMLGLFISGYGQGACNPATNKLISERAPEGRRGTVTGIKQSGVQLAILVGGFTLPILSIWSSWRLAIGVYAVVALSLSTVTAFALPDSRLRIQDNASDSVETSSTSLPRSVHLLSIYSLLMGCVVGGVSRYLVLFAENSLAMSNVKAGIIAGLPGGLAIATRILWAHLAEHRVAPSSALTIQSLFTALVMAMLFLAVGIGEWIMWPAAVLSAVGLNAWNAVVMLSVIIGVPANQSGRASGRVVMGFMVGLTLGGFLTGLTADATGGYETAWAGMLFLALAAAAIARGSGRNEQSEN